MDIDDEYVEKPEVSYPKMHLSQLRFQLTCPDDIVPNKSDIQQQLMTAIREDSKLHDGRRRGAALSLLRRVLLRRVARHGTIL